MFDIEDEGFNELIDLISSLEITEQKERSALNKAGEIVKNAIEENAPTETGGLRKSIKKSIKRVDGDLTCTIKTSRFYDVFTEYGTSFSKHKVGWFTKCVKDKENDVIESLKKSLLG